MLRVFFRHAESVHDKEFYGAAFGAVMLAGKARQTLVHIGIHSHADNNGVRLADFWCFSLVSHKCFCCI